MTRTKSPITGYFVDNRIVFYIAKSWTFGSKDRPDDLDIVDSFSDIRYVGFCGDYIDEIWNINKSFSLDCYEPNFDVLKVPADYPYSVKYDDMNENGSFGSVHPDDDSAYIDIYVPSLVDIDELEGRGFEIFELSESERDSLNPDNLTTDKAVKLLEKRIDGFNIS